jgi:glycosidase
MSYCKLYEISHFFRANRKTLKKLTITPQMARVMEQVDYDGKVTRESVSRCPWHGKGYLWNGDSERLRSLRIKRRTEAASRFRSQICGLYDVVQCDTLFSNPGILATVERNAQLGLKVGGDGSKAQGSGEGKCSVGEKNDGSLSFNGKGEAKKSASRRHAKVRRRDASKPVGGLDATVERGTAQTSGKHPEYDSGLESTTNEDGFIAPDSAGSSDSTVEIPCDILPNSHDNEVSRDERRPLGYPGPAFPPIDERKILRRTSSYDPYDTTLLRRSTQLLEISIRPYLYALCNKYSKEIKRIRDIPEEEFDEIQSMGFTWVWFMGIWQLGKFGLGHDRADPGQRERYSSVLPDWSEEDVIGYPLCIVSYEVDEELGNEDDLVWLREQFHRRDIKLMLDFVPDHTAVDSPEFKSRPELYLKGDSEDKNRFLDEGIAFASGRWIPSMHFSAQLNMFNPDTRRFVIDTLKSIGSRCDGVRVHVAHFCLNDLFWQQWSTELESWSRPSEEFWSEAIRELRDSHPSFVFMAETYGRELQDQLLVLGFDYIYDKELLDDLVNSNLESFRVNMVRLTDHYVHFVENHDEVRAIKRFWNNEKMSLAASALLLTLPGVRLFNFNQWLGYSESIEVHLRRARHESYREETFQFYKKLSELLGSDALKYGEWTPIEVFDTNTVLAWEWLKEDERFVIVVNYSSNGSGGRIHLRGICTDHSPVSIGEFMSGDRYERDPSEINERGLGILLDPYQVQVFFY